MKKLFLLLTSILFFVNGYSQTRFIAPSGQTFYGSGLPYGAITVYDTLTSDTVSIVPSYYLNLSQINHAWGDTLRDSLTVNLSVSGTQSFVGDQYLLFVKSGTRTSTVLRFTSTSVIPSGGQRIPLNVANKSWQFMFVFNGSKWILQYHTSY